MNKNKVIKLLFFLIVFGGLLIRLYFIFSKGLFIDEILYAETSFKTSFYNLLTLNHRLPDHGFIYLFFIKILLFLTHDLILIRLTNIPIYLITAIFIYKIFKKQGFGIVSLLPLIIFSFFSYFVFINVMISPYNFALLFALPAFYFSYKLLYQKKQGSIYPSVLLLPILIIFGFYSDFSFIYAGIYFLPLLLSGIILKRKNILILFIIFLISLLFIVPGIWQIWLNFKNIVSAGIIDAYKEQNIYYFMCNLSDSILLKQGNNLSLMIFAFILLLQAILVGLKRNFKPIYLISIIVFIINFVFIYIVNSYVSLIYFERSFWFIYLSLIFLLVGFINSVNSVINKFVAVLLTLMIILLINFRLTSGLANRFVPGTVYDFIDYKKLIYDLFKEQEKNQFKQIVIIRGSSREYPLWKYYFADTFKVNNSLFRLIKKLKERSKIIYIDHISFLTNNILKENSIFVIFNNDLELLSKFLVVTKNTKKSVFVIEQTETQIIMKQL